MLELNEEAITLQSSQSKNSNGTADLIQPVKVIEPSRGWIGINWKEIWRYRELLYFLTWRDVKIRYKQTVLGVIWVLLQPLLTMFIFTFLFGRIGGMAQKTGGIPYPIFVFAGLLPWNLFSRSVDSSGASLIGNANLISKVYFPRLIIPFSAVGAALVDFGVSVTVLMGMMAYYHTPISGQLFLLPMFLIGMLLAGAGVGTLLSALTVAYRDFKYVIPFLLQIWMFLTPVIYPSSSLPERGRWLLALNPMTGLVEGFRGALLARPIDWPHIGLSMVVSIAVFLLGATYFRKVERRFADII